MSVVEALLLLGGVATRAQLVTVTSRAAVDEAVAAGQVAILARGRYAVPEADEALALAHELSGTLSHRSAAMRWGRAVKTLPERPDVIVRRGRTLDERDARRMTVHRVDLHPSEVTDGCTSKDRTVLDCLRTLRPDEALAVADSVLRDGYSHRWLVTLARDARGRGSGQARRIAARATSLAANPFESVLRSIADEVPGLEVRPQVEIHDPGFLGRPDLVDEALRIVIEADSFEWHGGRAALARDARRDNALVVAGWLVLRFSWEDVMHDPELVRRTLLAAVARRTKVGIGDQGAA